MYKDDHPGLYKAFVALFRSSEGKTAGKIPAEQYDVIIALMKELSEYEDVGDYVKKAKSIYKDIVRKPLMQRDRLMR